MRVAVDGGALCQKGYVGNKVFTENLLKTISLYDNKNFYFVYTYCDNKLRLQKNIVFKKLSPRIGWLKIRLSIDQLLNDNDIFLALNQSIPLIHPKKVISFSHGLSYFFYPQFYPDSYHQLKSQLKEMIEKSAYIIVSSKKVKKELTDIFKKIEKKVLVLPFGLPYDMDDNNFRRKREKFFLFVGVDHPIKNLNFIKKAFKIFKKDKNFNDWKLVLITGDYSRKKLKKLYLRASGLLTASYYESFNFPVLESLSLGCPVIGLKSAIVPEFYKYVRLSEDINDFINNMKKVATEKTIISSDKIKEIKKIFNWQNYIQNLNKLFLS